MREKCKDGHASTLYLHHVQMQLVLGIWVWMGLALFPGTFPITVVNFLVVIFHIRVIPSPLSALMFMSQIIVHTIRLNVPLHMYIEDEVTGFSYMLH